MTPDNPATATETGIFHYREASLILTDNPCEYGCPHSGCPHEMRQIARAQVHATLFLGAATVAAEALKCGFMTLDEYGAWAEATGTGRALAGKDSSDEH